jgi:hypothetical protein
MSGPQSSTAFAERREFARSLGVSPLELHKAEVPIGATAELARDLLALRPPRSTIGSPLQSSAPRKETVAASVDADRAVRLGYDDPAQFEAARSGLFGANGQGAPPTASTAAARASRALELGQDPAQFEAAFQALFGGAK